MDRSAWVLIALGSLASVTATPVLAAETGFYFSAAVGRAQENPGASLGVILGNSQVTLHVDPDRVDVDSNDVAWSAALGYRINPYVAAEVEYLDLGTTKYFEQYTYEEPPPLGPLPVRFTRRYSSKVTGPALSVLGSVPLSNGFEVFLRAGAFFLDRKVDVGPSEGLLTTGGRSGHTSGSTVWLGGAGATWSFASRWTLRAEYQRTGEVDSTFLAVGADTERMSLGLLFRF